MFALLGAIPSAAKLAAGAALGLLIGWAATFAYTSAVTVPAAHQAGQMEERIVWQERQARAVAKAEVDRLATQAQIDAIEADYHSKEAARIAQMSALEQALQEEQANEPAPTPGACRPVISRGVLHSLDGVGRAAPRVDPAKPTPGMH